MTFDEGDTTFLCQLGFTKAQADLYLLLLKTGWADAKTIADNSEAARSAIYRTLSELQKMGLVEKEIGLPNKFKATPLDNGLQILMMQRTREYEQFKAKTAKFLMKAQAFQGESTVQTEYKFIMIEGKQRIIQRMKLQHDTAHKEVDILTTPNRWTQILEDCSENYEKALKRKVHYRIVVERSDWIFEPAKEIQSLLRKPNFELRLSQGILRSNAAVFDSKEATFTVLPSRALVDSPIIWTNNPSFLSMLCDHFEKIWTQSEKYAHACAQNIN